MKTLKGLDCRESAPIDSIDVPHGDGAHDTANAVAEETNGNDSQDDGCRTQRQVVKEILCRKHLNTSGGIGRRCGCDGADRMFFQPPGTRVEKFEDLNVRRKFAFGMVLPPTSFKFITTREDFGPCLAHEVADKNDESSGNGDGGRFELVDKEEHLVSQSSFHIRVTNKIKKLTV